MLRMVRYIVYHGRRLGIGWKAKQSVWCADGPMERKLIYTDWRRKISSVLNRQSNEEGWLGTQAEGNRAAGRSRIEWEFGTAGDLQHPEKNGRVKPTKNDRQSPSLSYKLELGYHSPSPEGTQLDRSTNKTPTFYDGWKPRERQQLSTPSERKEATADRSVNYPLDSPISL